MQMGAEEKEILLLLFHRSGIKFVTLRRLKNDDDTRWAAAVGE